jgi:membrane protein DedA with SNARE-associated domain
MISISVLLTSSYSLPLLFAITIAASYIIIPAIGWIIVSFGANAPNVMGLVTLFLIIYAATLIGDISVYFVARYFSKRVLKFMKKFNWYKKSEKRSKRLLNKYGFYIVFVSRFLVSEIPLVINYIAGFEKFNKRKFILAVILGEFIYAASYTAFGYIFKDTWTYLLGLITSSIRTVLLVILALYIIYRIIKLTRDRKNLLPN